AHTILRRAGAVLLDARPCCGPSVLCEATSQLESRMREIRTSGSEGGGNEPNRFSLPLYRRARRHAASPDPVFPVVSVDLLLFVKTVISINRRFLLALDL